MEPEDIQKHNVNIFRKNEIKMNWKAKNMAHHFGDGNCNKPIAYQIEMARGKTIRIGI